MRTYIHVQCTRIQPLNSEKYCNALEGSIQQTFLFYDTTSPSPPLPPTLPPPSPPPPPPRMTEAITASKGILSSSVKTLLNMGGGLTFDLEETFPSAETIPSHVTIDVSHDPRTILLVNSLSQRRTQLVALRVSSPNVMVGVASSWWVWLCPYTR